MESKKKSKKRSINEYRQVKDTVYRHPKKPKLITNNKYYRLYEEIKGLLRQYGNDQELGGSLRRTLLRFHESEKHRR